MKLAARRLLSTDNVRLSDIGIQMLPDSLRKSLFPNVQDAKLPDWKCRLIEAHLRQENLWGRRSTIIPHPQIRLPPLLGGQDLDKHFRLMAMHSYGEHIQLAKQFCRISLSTNRPPQGKWQTDAPGWTRYTSDGCAERVPFPTDSAMVFDVEVLAKHTKYPTIAVAASADAWYCWLSPVLFASRLGELPSLVSKDYEHLIPFGHLPDKPRLVVGHHISYDRARIKEEYALERNGIRFLDTMSLHAAVGGLTAHQRSQWLQLDRQLNESAKDQEIAFGGGDGIDETDMEWYKVSALNSLQSVARLHLGVELDKSRRELFIDGSVQDVCENIQDAIDYCADDVAITHRIFQQVFPKFHGRKTLGHPVPLAGAMEVGMAYLTVSDEWPRYVERCERMLSAQQSKIVARLRDLAEECLRSSMEQRTTDHFLRQLDWRPALKSRPDIPRWYRQLITPSKSKEPVITIRTRITPLLLRMTWCGYPLYYMGRTSGWCYRVPRDDPEAQRRGGETAAVSLQEFETAVDRLKRASRSGESAEEQYLAILQQDYEQALFFRLPTSSSGASDLGNCGSPFAKSFLGSFMDGKMSAEHSIAREAIEANVSCAYWISSRDRIKEQFVVRQQQQSSNDPSEVIGVIIPPIVPMGTITRRAVEPTWLTASNAKKNRIGSELKAQIRAPPGYAIVGADVDSQELWISSLLGDAQFGDHGATAFGWMALQGNKSDGTDLHSRSAQILQASRDHAKIFNYARIYGSGLRFAADLLLRCNTAITADEAQRRAEDLYRKTKGIRYFPSRMMGKLSESVCTAFGDRIKRPFWFGGSESYMFNALEAIATAPDPRTPVLGVQLPESLMPQSARAKYLPSCVNWVVQSSGVDYLHLILVSMRYLMDHYRINGRLLITIHDEIRFLVSHKDRYRAALALQVSNAWTRAYFAYKCGMNDLPLEANDRCVTPSFPEGIKENGESLSIFELLEKIKSDDMLDPETPSPTPAVEPATDGVSNDGLNSSFFKVDPEIFDEMARQNNELWLKLQMCRDRTEVNRILFGDSADRELVVDYGDLHRVTKYRSVKGFIEI